MPATYTHYTFTEDVYKLLPLKVKNTIDRDFLNIFGKSFDMIYFSKYKIGKCAHNNNVNKYFESIILYIKDNNLWDNKQIMGYLYGSLCHYILDSTSHPFICYKAGNIKGRHALIENIIDAKMFQDYNKRKIYNVDISKKAFKKIRFSNELNKIIDKVFSDVFNVQKGSVIYKKGYRNFRFIFKHGMISRFGIKSKIYIFLDKLNIFKVCFNNYCYYIKKIDDSYLNLDHKEWCYPANKKIKYHYSFLDLYDIALLKAKDIIIELDKVFLEDQDINEILKKIGNNNYITGLSCDKKLVMKYFETNNN